MYVSPHRAGGELQNVVDRLHIIGLEETVLDTHDCGAQPMS